MSVPGEGLGSETCLMGDKCFPRLGIGTLGPECMCVKQVMCNCLKSIRSQSGMVLAMVIGTNLFSLHFASCFTNDGRCGLKLLNRKWWSVRCV